MSKKLLKALQDKTKGAPKMKSASRLMTAPEALGMIFGILVYWYGGITLPLSTTLLMMGVV